jgi:CHASE3 domain sensor protein
MQPLKLKQRTQKVVALQHPVKDQDQVLASKISKAIVELESERELAISRFRALSMSMVVAAGMLLAIGLLVTWLK